MNKSETAKAPGDGKPSLAIPSISLPKGGGAIRGIGEKFGTNLVSGTGSMSVPIPTSPGRSGFGPQLSISYDSGSGNSPFGFGWALSLPSITRQTDKRLPQYRDPEDSDVFILSGAEDLVPLLVRNGQGDWEPEILPLRIVDGAPYLVRRYRPRIEGPFARIERWTNTLDAADVFWRSISKDNISTWYGKTSESRISDPANPSHIFSWLICQSYDDKGNVIVYGYKSEDSARVFEDPAGNSVVKGHESNRTRDSRSVQRYIKRVRYGHTDPYFPQLQEDSPWPEPVDASAQDGSNSWLFEVVFDYGDHDIKAPIPSASTNWPSRRDPFSFYRSGFEVRTYRTCRRVLMFHHFPDEAGGRDCLVRSTDFMYSDEVDPTDVRNPFYTFLRSVGQTGYQRNNGSYDASSFPTLDFEYSEPVVQDGVEDVDPSSLYNLPVGLDGTSYRWTDLHGEGLPGILTEQGGAWFYKRNLSPIQDQTPDGKVLTTARFAQLETVPLQPSVGLKDGAEFMDLAGDGQPDLVIMEGPTPGLYENDGAGGWQSFRCFTSRLNLDMRDPNLKFVDLTGDGHADVLITEDNVLIWHLSLAEEGFGHMQRIALALDEEKGPRMLFSDSTQSMYIADLSGDGLTDIVRVRNGEISYWPNLGYGHFGARVMMDNAPWFDNPDQFNPVRIRLADIDGSGTTDIIYVHRDGVRLYFNQSGNSWSKGQQLKVFPHLDEVASIVPIDLFGNGTACLVWSSPLSGNSRRQMRYVDLMGGSKPHLLIKTANNLGAETRIDYAPSTKFYLLDKGAGTPWITRLPFPVHLVEKVVTYDHVSRNRWVNRYAYHHGYFDGEEREFRGFGMVEQWDTEEFATLADGNVSADNIAPESHVPPVHTKNWFHTGLYPGRDHVSDYFGGLLNGVDKGEYFREPGLTDEEARTLLLSDTVLPDGLTVEEEREACRALKGSLLRQEVYADDAGRDSTPEQVQRARTPYTLKEQNLTIHTVQPRGPNGRAVFFTHTCEAISYNYARNPADPRIQHALTLEVDPFGNVLKQAALAYGRRDQMRVVDAQGNVQQVPNPGLAALDPIDQVKQTTPQMTYGENRVTNAIDTVDAYRAPLPCEVLTFELTGYTSSGAAGRFQASDLVEPDAAAAGRLRHKFIDQVPYEAPSTSSPCRRPIEWLRTLYRSDDLNGLLPLGNLDALALPGQNYRLAFTSGLLIQVFQRFRAGQPAELLLPDPAAVLGGQGGDRGGYLQSQALKAAGSFPATDADDHWWIPSGQSFFTTNPLEAPAAELTHAQQHFFLPRRYRNPFDQDAFVDFDVYDLLMTETRDALGNRVTVDVNDYRVLQPRLVSDPNRNRTEVAFDTIGMVVGVAVMGKPLPNPVEGDTLKGFVADLTPAQLDSFLDAADPHASASGLLGDATNRIVYDLHLYRRTRQANPSDPTKWQPVVAATLSRETHLSAPLPQQELRIQASFSYSDGFGREIQKKIQAEPGPVPQRDGNGNIIVDIDGQLMLTPDHVSPRWVGSGWTVFNNKGKPVRQYEPFFTDTHRFELDMRIGVSPVLFYDPVEHVVATLHPNHTYEKVVFTPWQESTYDVNDTCAAHPSQPGEPGPPQTGDPRSDPDIGGYVKEYFKTQPATWQTWHARRIGNDLGADERNAAERAAAHADTPTTAHFDALGRPFLTIARNRVVCPGHDLNGTEESFATRVEMDIEGNQRALRDSVQQAGDPLGRIVRRCAYDLLGSRIHQASQEAGTRWVVNDVTGSPIRAWDSRGHNFTTHYDELRRPVKQTVRGTFSDADPLKPNSDPRTLNLDVLVDKIEYGEPSPGANSAQESEAQRLNLRTRILRHFDSAGIATNAHLDTNGDPKEAYDFKGNLLCNTRQLVTNYTAIPDWLLEPQLDTEKFEGTTRYDALNRPIQSIAPHSSLNRPGHPNKFNVIQPVFNAANLLERVDVWLERAAEPTSLLDPVVDPPSPVGVADIDYDAKGQRTLIDYKTRDATVIRTTYTYDRPSFRLTHLYTRRGVDPATAQSLVFSGDCESPAPPPATIPSPDQPPEGTDCALQNLHYTYDPVGNITHIRDNAQQTVYFRNRRVEPSNDYVYDALYRLIQADGREHLGQGVGGQLMAPTAPGGFNDSHTRLVHPGDGNAMGTYTERYVYDGVGNFLQMQHRSNDPAHAGWIRAYTYAETSLTEPGKQSNRLTSTRVGNGAAAVPETYLHDAHGNVLRLPHLGGGGVGPNMNWDYQDQLLQIDKGGGGATFYVYDASGQRVRKVWEKSGLTEERIYLGGGFEIFRRHDGAIGTKPALMERETLHLMDDKQRIALVETRTLSLTPHPDDPLQLIRYQLGNHLRSSSLELDERAQIISYEEYTPHGSSTYEAVRSQTETGKRYRYTGKERDEESGLNYHGARYYAAWLGRWTGCDPAESVDGTNVYCFVRCRPIVFMDLHGEQADASKEFLPGLITDYPRLGQAWREAAEVTLENRFGKVSYARNMDAFKNAIDALPEGAKRTEYARELFNLTRSGFYRRAGRLYERGIRAFGGTELSKAAIEKLKAGSSPGGNVQIDHAIDDLALNPKEALNEMNLGMRQGHAGVPGGSHHAATEGRKALRASQDTAMEAKTTPKASTEAKALNAGEELGEKAVKEATGSVGKKALKWVAKSAPGVGALHTLFGPGEANAGERVVRALAGEIGIGPIDLESVWDYGTYLLESAERHRASMKSDPEYRKRHEEMVQKAYEHAWDWTNEPKW